MQTLVDFLNHGILPFSGRDDILATVIAFRRGAVELSELRLLLLLGEAGVGKSRLIEELLPQAHREGGVVVHTKLLPETSGSITPLLASALWRSDSVRYLLRSAPEESIDGVLGGLRRLSRLRPVLLVVEDAHLLRGESLRELATLLEGLSDESLAVLIAARPLNQGLHDVVAPWMSERLELGGLGGDDLVGLWEEIFGTEPDASIVASIVEATAGNPLAIRSVLRGGVASGAIEPIGRDASQRVRIDRAKLLADVRSNAGRIGSGMAAHLAPEELHAAGELASLGEAFARETALALLDDDATMIERLTFRGIVTLLATPSMPLVGLEREVPDYPASASPLLTFTHTLLHRHLLERGERSTTPVARLLARGLPFYSLLPVQIVTQGDPPELSSSEAASLLQRLRYIALDLIVVADYEEGRETLRGMGRLFDRLADSLDPDERHDLTVGMLFLETGLDWYGENVEENRRISRRLMELTENPGSVREATRRIAAMAKVHRLEWHNRELRDDYWQNVMDLAERFPDLRYTHTWSLFLSLVADHAINAGEFNRVREVEARLREMEGHPEGERLAAYVRGWLGPILLRLFETPEELQLRLEQMNELDTTIETPAQRSDLLRHQLHLFTTIGMPDRVIETVEMGMPLFRRIDNQSNIAQAIAMRLHAEAALGVDRAAIQRSAVRSLAEMPVDAQPQCRQLLGSHLAEAGMLCGDAEWTRAIIGTFADDTDPAPPVVRLWLALEAHDMSAVPDEVEAPLAECAALMRRGDLAGALQEVAAMLAHPLIRTSDIMLLDLGLLLAANQAESVATGMKQALRDALLRGLEWLAERRLAAFMGPLLDRAGGYLPSKEVKGWRARAAAIARQRGGLVESVGEDDRTRITMFGTIEVRPSGGEPQKISGARMKTVLGLIVAAAISDRPMSHREFCRLATGEDDPERGRNIVYVRLHALRELLGSDAILTEAETAPRLNLQRVACDLLLAHQALLDARAAARDGAFMRATPALMRALELVHGEVPFPGLYDDYFEEGRDDFENLLRGTLLRIATDLLREGDAENAERLLRQGYEATPDDEEMAEKFCEALTRRGRRAEAERVRREISNINA